MKTQVEEWITKSYGKRCKEYEEGCPICDEWKLYEEYELAKKEENEN